MESFIAVFSFSNVLRRLAELHVAVLFLAIKGPRRYIVLLADGLGRFTPICLTQNADTLSRTMRFAFHAFFAIGLRNTHIKTGPTVEGHANAIDGTAFVV